MERLVGELKQVRALPGPGQEEKCCQAVSAGPRVPDVRETSSDALARARLGLLGCSSASETAAARSVRQRRHLRRLRVLEWRSHWCGQRP
jgi:hypothetical protein